VFDEAMIGPLHAERHGWSKEHQIYNEAVREQFGRFLERNNIRPEQMTPNQARSFVLEILGSRDPRIRNYNVGILKRELQYRLRWGFRGTE
jgi:hypothetical protein